MRHPFPAADEKLPRPPPFALAPFASASRDPPARVVWAADKTCKLWNAENGDLYHTYRGHSTEIVCLSFNPQGTMVATGSMDNTARLWDVETGECLHTLLGHTAEVTRATSDRCSAQAVASVPTARAAPPCADFAPPRAISARGSCACPCGRAPRRS